MLQGKIKRRTAEAMLLLTAMIWGSGFVVMKNALEVLPIHLTLGLRFAIAAALMAPFLWKRLRHAGRKHLGQGLALGVVMYAAYAVQTYGLALTTAGENAFLTAVYVILVPLLVCGLRRIRPGKMQLLAACVCLLGIGVLALDSNFHLSVGNLLSLMSGCLYAVHIMMVDRFTEQSDVLVLTNLQFIVCGVLGFAFSFVFEGKPTAMGGQAWFCILYLAVVGTLIALTLQNIGIRYADPSHSSLIMGMESVFGCLFGALFLQEVLSSRVLLGSVLILCAIVLSELRLRRESTAQMRL